MASRDLVFLICSITALLHICQSQYPPPYPTSRPDPGPPPDFHSRFPRFGPPPSQPNFSQRYRGFRQTSPVYRPPYNPDLSNVFRVFDYDGPLVDHFDDNFDFSDHRFQNRGFFPQLRPPTRFPVNRNRQEDAYNRYREYFFRRYGRTPPFVSNPRSGSSVFTQGDGRV